MAVLLENVANCLLLAFTSLHQEQDGLVNKSKLKVLTANIGTLLDLYGVEKGLDHFKESQCLDFNQFKQYLRQEVFASLPETIALGELRTCESKIAEVCWLVCRKQYLLPEGKIDSESVYKLFRIFCLLAESSQDAGQQPQVRLAPAEAEALAVKLAALLGNPWDEDDFTRVSISIGSFPFLPLLNVLETRCVGGVVAPRAVADAVQELHQTLVEDVLKKGMLAKRGYILHTMREYWFVLRPCELSYFKTASEREKCGAITLQPGDRVETRTEFRLVLHTPERSVELAAADQMGQLQWHTALRSAIEYSASKQSYQRLQATKRRKQRYARAEEMLRAKEQLQLEKSARELAEDQAKQLEDVVRADARRLMELELINERLEKLLAEETQAKRDEEIVRGLQARLLAEEWEKRAELEALQATQVGLLEEESKKRQEYEKLQERNALQLIDAQSKLAVLQAERAQLDEELKVALSKTKTSEGRREYLEKLLLEFGTSGFSDGSKLRFDRPRRSYPTINTAD